MPDGDSHSSGDWGSVLDPESVRSSAIPDAPSPPSNREQKNRAVSAERNEIVNEEGWYKDPYARHESRWISDGTPTALVRDAGVASQDPPPDDPVTMGLERVVEATREDGTDLRRADEAERQDFNPDAMTDAAEESIDSSW